MEEVTVADAPARQFGRYRVVAELGRGAMGVVYKAEDPSLGRTVAIKTVLLSVDAHERAEYEARFYQEAKAAGSLNHPNIITIYEMGRENDAAFIAMELLDGIELRELMKAGDVPLPRALDLAAQVADALAFAHEHGVVHRDIKPGNIMVVHGRHAKVMDFGIAKVRLSDVKTQAGSILGSPKYMSPEQAEGVRTDHRSDIFSLGVTIYELVTGQPPFDAPDLAQLMFQISTAAPRPPTSIKPTLPAMIDLILAKALDKDPDARYQDARELAADLRACMEELESSQRGVAYEKTLKLSARPRAEPPHEETRTVHLESPAARPSKPPAGGTAPEQRVRLIPARGFDSSDALERLAGGNHASTVGRSGGVRRLLSDPLQRRVGFALAAALVIAALLAFT